MNLTEATLHLQNDPEFKKVIETTTLPSFSPSGNVYFDLLDSIVSQQLSGKVAATIFDRFLSLFPDRNPAPPLLVAMSPELMRSIGLSTQKASYLKNVAQYAIEHSIDNNIWDNKSDIEIIHELSRIKGVGTWTVEMILIFTLGRPDIFPVDDLGIQQAMMCRKSPALTQPVVTVLAATDAGSSVARTATFSLGRVLMNMIDP